MNGIFESMIRPVYKYEETILRLMGDAILAFFGAQIAHEVGLMQKRRAPHPALLLCTFTCFPCRY